MAACWGKGGVILSGSYRLLTDPISDDNSPYVIYVFARVRDLSHVYPRIRLGDSIEFSVSNLDCLMILSF